MLFLGYSADLSIGSTCTDPHFLDTLNSRRIAPYTLKTLKTFYTYQTMAKITLNQPIAEIHGALSKRSNIVNRQKKYRINGRVIHEGKQEAYAIVNPRDWKKTPAQGAELANQTAWQEACRRAAQPRPLFFESVCSFSQITFGYFSYYPATSLMLVDFPPSNPRLYTLH
jgi:hypothetical protein